MQSIWQYAVRYARPPDSSSVRGVIFLGGLREVADPVEATRVNREAFEAAHALAARFEDPESGAGVFVTVQDKSSGDVIAADAPTIYEGTGEPMHYPAGDSTYFTPGAFEIPAGTSQCVVTFRVVLAGSSQEFTRNITIDLK